MINVNDIQLKIDIAKKRHSDACERGNGLVAEYYEGVLDTLNEIIDLIDGENK